jgi:hypothetical protein
MEDERAGPESAARGYLVAERHESDPGAAAINWLPWGDGSYRTVNAYSLSLGPQVTPGGQMAE